MYNNSDTNNNTAEGYQQNSCFQREDGKRFLQNEVKPRLGDTVLDLGCGTGELSTYLAELVGQQGKVIAVDPDLYRLKLAQESHKRVKNLTFSEGSASNFPGMASETYDIIFSNYVLHWVPDKEQAFKNMFSSLKPGGKIALQYNDHIPTLNDHAYKELNPENLNNILIMYNLKPRPVIEEMCSAAGFNILKSWEVERSDRELENVDSLCSFLRDTTNGAFDPQFATKDRLARFCDRYSNGAGSAPIKFFAEKGDSHCALVAAKPAI